MRINQFYSKALTLIFLASLLAGCASPGAPANGTEVYPPPEATSRAASPGMEDNLPPEVTRPAPPAEAAASIPSLAGGNGEFAFDLYQALRAGEGNLFFSPYSLSSALAMTYAGARGETQRQMAATLHYPLAPEQLGAAFNALDQQLTAGGAAGKGAFQLNSASSLWGEQSFPFLQPFLDGLARDYGAGMNPVDVIDPGQREAARQAINRWVDTKTQGKIKDLIPQGVLDDLTRLVLANAIYFKGEWIDPFHGGTQEAPFTRLDGSPVTAPLMSRRSQALYAEGQDYQAIELPYKGERIAMDILLPASGQFEAFEGSLTQAKVGEILQALQETDVKLYLPRFSFSSKLQLEKTLPSLGMPDAFDDQKADFSGMYDPSQAGGQRLYIGHVVHQAFVAVDEEGTEAAAASGVVMEITSMPRVMRVDRPFIFLIRDRQTGTILFMGRCMDPTEK